MFLQAPAYLGSPRQRAIKRLCLRVLVHEGPIRKPPVKKSFFYVFNYQNAHITKQLSISWPFKVLSSTWILKIQTGSAFKLQQEIANTFLLQTY